MAMIYDGAGPKTIGSASLRITTEPGTKYFTRDSSGSFRVKTKGVWVSYCQYVYNVSTQEEECRREVEIGGWRRSSKVVVEPIFIPDDYLSYISLSGMHLLEGLEVENVVHTGKLVKITLSLEDILVEEEGIIKAIGKWNTPERKAENFRQTGRYTKSKMRTDS